MEERSPGAPHLRVAALGPLEIDCLGKALPERAWRYAKPRELLLYLVCHPKGRTREQVGLAFWPEATPEQVKNNFHVALHRLRTVLEFRGWIVQEQERYRLRSDVVLDFDADRFESGIAEALRTVRAGEEDEHTLDALDGPLALYRGELFESTRVGDWHLARRDRLHGLFVDTQNRVGNVALRLGAHGRASAAFERVLEIDVAQEGAYRGLMIARVRAGDRAGALRLYERAVRSLESQLGAVPAPDTAALADRIRRGEAV